MRRQRKELSSHGLYYPKGPIAGRSKPLRALLRATRGGDDAKPAKSWDELVVEIDRAEAERVLVSHENFAKMRAQVAKRVVDELKVTHVIAAARRYDEFLPSQWQQLVKTGATLLPYEDWLRKEIGPGGRDRSGQVWRSHDTVRLTKRWGALVPPESLFVVAIDESDRQLVPRAFESLLALPAGTLDMAGSPANPSLTFHETEIMRSTLATIVEHGQSFDQAMRRRIRRVLFDSRDTEFGRDASTHLPKRPPLPEWAIPEIERLSTQRADALSEAPIQLIGDVDNLRVRSADLLPSDSWAQWEDQRLMAHQAGAALAFTLLGGNRGPEPEESADVADELVRVDDLRPAPRA